MLTGYPIILWFLKSQELVLNVSGSQDPEKWYDYNGFSDMQSILITKLSAELQIYSVDAMLAQISRNSCFRK